MRSVCLPACPLPSVEDWSSFNRDFLLHAGAGQGPARSALRSLWPSAARRRPAHQPPYCAPAGACSCRHRSCLRLSPPPDGLSLSHRKPSTRLTATTSPSTYSLANVLDKFVEAQKNRLPCGGLLLGMGKMSCFAGLLVLGGRRKASKVGGRVLLNLLLNFDGVLL